MKPVMFPIPLIVTFHCKPNKVRKCVDELYRSWTPMCIFVKWLFTEVTLFYLIRSLISPVIPAFSLKIQICLWLQGKVPLSKTRKNNQKQVEYYYMLEFELTSGLKALTMGNQKATFLENKAISPDHPDCLLLLWDKAALTLCHCNLYILGEAEHDGAEDRTSSPKPGW